MSFTLRAVVTNIELCADQDSSGEIKAFPHKTLGSLVDKHLEERKPPLLPRERRVFNWHVSNLEYANATNLKNLSLQHWDQDDIYAFKGPHCMLKQGYGKLAERMCEGFQMEGGEVKLNTKVVEINHNKETNRVEVKSGDGSTYAADYCVVTLPLGVLKGPAVSFNPPLSDDKRKAIRSLGYGILNKVFLVFNECFWDPLAPTIGCVSGKHLALELKFKVKAK